MNKIAAFATWILGVFPGFATADIIVNSGAELKVAGSVTAITVQTTAASKVSGIGTINGSVTGAGDIAPGTTATPYGTLLLNGAVSTSGSYLCDLSGTSLDKIKVAATLDISPLTLVLPTDATNFTEAIYIISSYGTLSGAAFADVQNLPSGYTMVYTHNDGISTTNVALVQLSAFESWAAAVGLPSGEDGADDDPNGDEVPNIAHFAFDTDPLGDGSDEDKTRLSLEDIGGVHYLTVTLPIRTGATFSGAPLTSDTINGIIYSILGDTDLEDPWDLSMVELVPALDTDLPSLGDYDGTAGADWEYRTFRLTDPFSALPRAFIKATVGTTP